MNLLFSTCRMPEKTQRRNLRKNHLETSDKTVEIVGKFAEENSYLWEKDFKDVLRKIENYISKCMKDTELGQRETFRFRVRTFPFTFYRFFRKVIRSV